jgi:tetratricopeptide (TPR) repeat protein
MVFELVIAALLVGEPQASAHGPGDAARADQLAAQAERARGSNPAQAIALYRDALSLRPDWADGWWNLGTLLYDGDAYGDAAAAFRRAADLSPTAGTALVMLGLCEFKLGQFDQALVHIQDGRQRGVSSDPQFRHVMQYHEGVLLLHKAEFERAQELLDDLSAEGVESDELTIALGESVLRIRPAEMAGGGRDELQIVRRAGHAAQLAARKQFDGAGREYEALAHDYPHTRNVHYALGRYFVQTSQPARASAAYEQELTITPDHVPALLGIAAIKAETDPAGALPYAERGVAINPRVPLGHYLLGSLLLHTDHVERAIAELEIARKAVPQDPGVYYALGRAYARAGRPKDAEQARATFTRLNDARQRAARRAPDGADATTAP